jgi:hypothetical protein
MWRVIVGLFFLCWIRRNSYPANVYPSMLIRYICVRRVKKKRSHEQDLYKIFLFLHTHVTVDTYKNKVHHNRAIHAYTGLYGRCTYTKITIVPSLTNRYDKISIIIVFDGPKKNPGEEHRSRSSWHSLIAWTDNEKWKMEVVSTVWLWLVLNKRK